MNYFNLLVDDFFPLVTPKSREWQPLAYLLKEYPSLKVTLFTIANATGFMAMGPGGSPCCPLDKYPAWVEWVNGFDQSRIEIAYHGYFHWNFGLNNSMEFFGIGEDDILFKVEKMIQMFDKKIRHPLSGFRVPAHRCNPSLYAILSSLGIEYLSTQRNENPDIINELLVIESGNGYLLNSHFGAASPNSLSNPEVLADIERKIAEAEKHIDGTRFVTLREISEEVR